MYNNTAPEKPDLYWVTLNNGSVILLKVLENGDHLIPAAQANPELVGARYVRYEKAE